jgi:vancomycin resistance protein YoaR
MHKNRSIRTWGFICTGIAAASLCTGLFLMRAVASVTDLGPAPVNLHAAFTETPPIPRRLLERLQRRVQTRLRIDASLDSLAQFVRTQRSLLSRHIDLQYITDAGEQLATEPVSIDRFPRWMRISTSDRSVTASIDRFAVAEDLALLLPERLHPPVHAQLTSLTTDRQGVQRASTSGTAQPGYELHLSQAVQGVRRALLLGQESVVADVRTVPSTVTDASGAGVGDLTLLASGVSDFGGSPDGRAWNVRKGLLEHMHNVVVQPGATFSFNAALGSFPSNGPWREALGIFDGGDLRPTIGGGLCQVATTVYRAALNAGLPLLNRANHSLYVHYYEEHGVGLDATVFYGKQDLTFRNDTRSPLLLQASVRGTTAIVRLYGKADGRKVTFAGPYFTASATGALAGKIRANEIAWMRTIAQSNGGERRETIISRYNAIPRSLPKRFKVSVLDKIE